MEGPLLDIPLCCCTCIDFAAITLEEEEEEEAEESGDSDEEIGLDYLSKDIGSVRITISQCCMLNSSLQTIQESSDDDFDPADHDDLSDEDDSPGSDDEAAGPSAKKPRLAPTSEQPAGDSSDSDQDCRSAIHTTGLLYFLIEKLQSSMHMYASHCLYKSIVHAPE